MISLTSPHPVIAGTDGRRRRRLRGNVSERDRLGSFGPALLAA
jgi:hypothetical protein